MKRSKGAAWRYGIIFGLFFLGSFCLFACGKDRPEQTILEDDSVEEAAIRENILTDSNVIDLGNHITAYRTSSDIIDTNYKGAYLAIHDLGGGEILYLPDVYQEVYEIKIEDKEEVFISYSDTENNSIQSVHIPIRFPAQVNNEYEIYTLQEKILTEVRNNINACTDALPRLIWKENINREGKTYEITFERTSPAYKPLISEIGGFFADYCLTVKDEEDNILTEQSMINYPVDYEEVYWFTDFSGDDFPDIVFCTDYAPPKNGYAHLEFMIWNAQTEEYEAKPLPVRRIDMPLWNETLSSVIFFYGGEERVTLGMYSFRNGKWELVRELLPVYDENDVDEYGNALCNGQKEVFYENGEVVEENSVMTEENDTPLWFDEESIWCKYNKENLGLYPDSDWERTEVIIGEDGTYKYVRR